MSKLLFATLAAALCAACSSGEPAGPKPDLMLITVDTLRADHLGPYRELYAGPEGPARVETPAIDEFAAASLVFAEAYTAIPITTASLGTILSGQLPRHHGDLNNAGDMSLDVRTVVMALKDAGYDTAAFLPTFLADKESFKRGFDVYDFPAIGQPIRPGTQVVKRATTWLSQREAAGTDTPTFVWVHLFDPHAPYDPGPELERKHLGDLAGKIPSHLRDEVFLDPSKTYDKELPIVRGLYKGDVELTDAALAPLFREILHRPATARERLTILTADHGEHLAERESYIGHTGFLHDEMLRVPFIVHSSTGAVPARKVDYPAFTADVAGTMAEYAGVGGQWGYETGAKPLLLEDFLDNELAVPKEDRGQRLIVHETFAPEGFYDQRAVRLGDVKWIVGMAEERPAGLFVRDGAEVRDLGNDPSAWDEETRGQHAKIVAVHDSWLDEVGPVQRIDSTLTPEQQAELEAMGYMGEGGHGHGHGAPKKPEQPSDETPPDGDDAGPESDG